MPCPGEEVLAQFVDGLAPRELRAEIESHVEGCEACRALLVAWARRPGAARPAEAVGAPGVDAAAELVRGAGVGRFLLLEHLGTGGMGVVWSAYDPQLDRRVALKFLRPDLEGDGDLERARARLLREARAMARLAHANVVAVHEVLLAGDRVVIAMELVEGQTLKAWLAQERRPWRAVVDVFLQAGRGLAAAHAAGMVHRDFKPDNVVIGGDGRARVTDFGLARAVAAGEQVPGPEGGAAVADPSLTRAGALLGTPAYMAPEQVAGLPADARSDQFSFCVALYEALSDQRPFEDPPARAFAAGEGARPWPVQSVVPRQVRAAVSRGLSLRPADRHPDLDSLLAGLDAARAPRHRGRWLAAAALLAVLAGAGVYGWRSHRVRCEGGAERWRQTWNQGRKAEVRAALLRTGQPFALTAWTAVEGALDAYGDAWIGGYGEACTATRIRHEQSEQVLDLRVACLQQRMGQVRALVDQLAAADGEIALHAVEATGKLTSVATCAELTRLLAPVPRPAEPAARTRIEAAQAELSRLRVLRDTGQTAAALAAVPAVLEEARALGWAPLLAEALEVRGTLAAIVADEQTSGIFQDAVNQAMAGRAFDLAVRASIGLVWLTNTEANRASAHRWSAFAGALLEGMGGDDALEAQLLTMEGGLEFDEGRFGEAEKANRAALDHLARVRPVDGILTAKALNNLADDLYSLGRYQEAADTHRRAYDFMVEHLGRDHPYIAVSLDNLAEVLTTLGRLEEALTMERQALVLAERGYGPGSWAMANAHWALGRTLERLGRTGEAEEHLERALPIAEQSGGHVWRAPSIQLDLAALDLARGRPQRALERARRARQDFAALYPGGHPSLGRSDCEVGLALLALGRPRAAVAPLERAVAALGGDVGETPEAARARFGLARALFLVGDRGRARELAEGARELYRRVVAGYPGELREIDRWLESLASAR